MLELPETTPLANVSTSKSPLLRLNKNDVNLAPIKQLRVTGIGFGVMPNKRAGFAEIVD